MAKIGRNDPCPCGSGKKYKRCCINKIEIKNNNNNLLPSDNFDEELEEEFDEEFFYDDDERDIINLENIPDYGNPQIDYFFFDNNRYVELSAQNILYSTLVCADLEEFATEISSKFIQRGLDEKLKIEKAEKLEELIEILINNPDPLNHLLLRKRIIEFGAEAIDLIFTELLNPQNVCLFEQGLRIIYESKIECKKKIIHLLKNCDRDCYFISLILILLALSDFSHETKKILWDYYHFFKEYFPKKNYKEGPLIGLMEVNYQQRKLYESKELTLFS